MDIFDVFEKVLYEARPTIYALMAGFSFHHRYDSYMMFGASLILAVCSYAVFKMRYEYRYKLQKVDQRRPRRHH